MLETYQKGYAVASKDLSGYSFQDESLESCKRCCRDGSVIIEMIPKVVGITLSVWMQRFYDVYYFKYRSKNILWLHWSTSKVYRHKQGRIVCQPNQSSNL